MLELGGAQKNTLYTLAHLDPRRFQGQLLSGPGGILNNESRELVAKGVEVSSIPCLVRPIRPWKDLPALFQIWRTLRAFKPDILHTHSSKAGIIGRVAGALAGVPVIIHTYHGFGFNRAQKPWTRAGLLWAEKLAALFTKKLIFVSEANKREAESLGIGRPEQYALIRSGIRKPIRANDRAVRQFKEDYGIPPEAPVVTTIGPFKPQKNLIDFLRIAKAVSGLHHSCRFLLVGDGEQRKMLEKEIRGLSLEGRVIMTGWLRRSRYRVKRPLDPGLESGPSEIELVLSASDVFIMTPLWEGLPRSLVEAMSLGVPPVCYDTDGVNDIIKDGENGFLFKPGEIEPMARQIDRVLKHEGMRRTVGQAAQTSIGEDFDIDHMVRRQETLYEEMTRRSAS